MSADEKPIAINAFEVPSTRATLYPPPFAARVAGREKRRLGDFFGLQNFGINLTRLEPKAISALRHSHSRQDEFIYVVQGEPVLSTDRGRVQLSPGMCAGFPAGSDNANHLINETSEVVIYLEIGDRTEGDEPTYPDDDIQASMTDGKWVFSHKDGTPY